MCYNGGVTLVLSSPSSLEPGIGWKTQESMSSSPGTPRLLIVENDPCLRRLLSALLTEEGYAVIGTSSLSQALVLTQEQVFNGIFTTLFPEGDQNPFLSIEPLRVQTSPTPIAVLSRCWVAQQEAEQRGYAGVLEFPFRSEAVLQVLARRITCPFSPTLAH